MASQPALFTPFKLGQLSLSHRVVLAPLTRNRANKAHVPDATMSAEYYSQRAGVPGTLLIAEATYIARKASGLLLETTPGVYTDEQISQWKKIVDAVHAKGSYIFLQIWALGRGADPTLLRAFDPTYDYVSAGNVPPAPSVILKEEVGEIPKPTPPRPLTREEIKEYVQLYATAASNAVDKAGFDGVEIHGANGYLIDQFLKGFTNNRTDEYGGSPGNQARFALEVVEAVTAAVGPERTGLRLSPWHGISTTDEADAAVMVPVYTHLVEQIRERFPSLAYLHFIEPRILGFQVREVPASFTNDVFRKTWGARPFISAGGHDRASAIAQADAHPYNLVSFGRHFIANPDLPARLKKDLPLTPYNRATFYTTGPVGYTDYPFADS